MVRIPCRLDPLPKVLCCTYIEHQSLSTPRLSFIQYGLTSSVQNLRPCLACGKWKWSYEIAKYDIQAVGRTCIVYSNVVDQQDNIVLEYL